MTRLRSSEGDDGSGGGGAKRRRRRRCRRPGQGRFSWLVDHASTPTRSPDPIDGSQKTRGGEVTAAVCVRSSSGRVVIVAVFVNCENRTPVLRRSPWRIRKKDCASPSLALSRPLSLRLVPPSKVNRSLTVSVERGCSGKLPLQIGSLTFSL